MWRAALVIGIVVAGLLLIVIWVYAIQRDPIGVGIGTIGIAATLAYWVAFFNANDRIEKLKQGWEMEKEDILERDKEYRHVCVQDAERRITETIAKEREQWKKDTDRCFKVTFELQYYAWETIYLRKNPGSRVSVRVTEQNGASYAAVRELLSPSNEVVRQREFGETIYDG